MFTDRLSKRARKFYREHPGAYLEMKGFRERGSRPCPGCGEEVSFESFTCPECGRTLRKYRGRGIFLALMAGALLLLLAAGSVMLFVLGRTPECDDPESLELLRERFDFSLYASTLGLKSVSALVYGIPEGGGMFSDRYCRGLVALEDGREVHLEYTIVYRFAEHPQIKFKLVSEP